MVLEGVLRDELDDFIRLNKLQKPINGKENVLRNRFQAVPVTANLSSLSQSSDTATR